MDGWTSIRAAEPGSWRISLAINRLDCSKSHREKGKGKASRVITRPSITTFSTSFRSFRSQSGQTDSVVKASLVCKCVLVAQMKLLAVKVAVGVEDLLGYEIGQLFLPDLAVDGIQRQGRTTPFPGVDRVCL